MRIKNAQTNVFILLLSFIIYGWIEFETLLFVGNIVFAKFPRFVPHSIHRNFPYTTII